MAFRFCDFGLKAKFNKQKAVWELFYSGEHNHDAELVSEGLTKLEKCSIDMIVRLEDDDGRSIRAFLDTKAFSKLTGREQGEKLDEVINMDPSLDFVQEIVGRRVKVAVTSNRSPISGGSPPVHTVEAILTPEDFAGEASQQKKNRRRR